MSTNITLSSAKHYELIMSLLSLLSRAINRITGFHISFFGAGKMFLRKCQQIAERSQRCISCCSLSLIIVRCVSSHCCCCCCSLTFPSAGTQEDLVAARFFHSVALWKEREREIVCGLGPLHFECFINFAVSLWQKKTVASSYFS